MTEKETTPEAPTDPTVAKPTAESLEHEHLDDEPVDTDETTDETTDNKRGITRTTESTWTPKDRRP